MSACLDDNAIAALLDEDVPPAERAEWTAHIDACPSCRALVAEAAGMEGPEGPRVLAAGTRLGRYVVLETVGAGAMGVVYAAYDPELGRKVALKLLRPDPLADSGSTSARGRLLREAQALAKLAHPHVISIHDVGTLGGEIFLAMEFVEGGTLGDWLDRGPREWRAVVGLMRQVGEGLAAAHAVGLVHRDLKPDNVLVGAGERARVTDFGLARGAEEHDASLDRAEGDASDRRPPPAHLTVTGMLMGTPAYMAPEQLAGRPADAASDQFSYCVTFHEALYGERPFEGGSVASLARAVARGEVRAAPAGRRVPKWLRKIVARGLLADPEARFPSMRALLDALAAGPPISARQLGAAAVLAALVPLAILGVSRRAPAATCTGADAAWSGAWGEGEKSAVRAAFARTGKPSAGAAASEVARILDDEGDAWRRMHKETCEATRVRGEESEARMDLRMRCLADRRSEVAALSRLLAGADADLVDHAVSAALSLPTLADCANVRALPREAALPGSPGARARVEQLGTALAEASALEYAGKYREGTGVATAALDQARGAGYAPLVAKLLLVLGRLTSGARDFPRAERVLHEAAAVAQDTGDDAVAADAWTVLIRIVGFHLSKPDDARVWARYAEGAIHRLGGDDEREATRLRALATVAWRREGKFDEARDLIVRARGLYDQSRAARHDFEIASCDEGLAGVYFDTARAADALVLHEKAAAVRERLFGADHPSIATSCVNRGEDLTKLGRPDEAIPLIERAIALSAPTHARGGDAYYHHRLAAALRARGDFPAALAEDEAALAGHALSGEKGGYWESWALTGKGIDLLALGRAPEAVDPLERAVAERAAHSIPVEVAESRFALARALFATGAKDRARSLAAEAEAILAPDADRFGSWYGEMRGEMKRWLAEHAAAR